MKRFFLATAAIAGVMASPAHAANFILTDDALIGANLSNFYIETATATQVDATIRRPGVSGAVNDNFFFAPLTLSYGTGSSITSNAALTFGNPGLTITAYALGALDPTNPIYAALVTGFTTANLATYNAASNALDALSTTPLQTVSATNLSNPQSRTASITLDPAFYYKININGTVAGGTAQYNGNLTSTTVPEPATWAMMLLGFGAVGFAMRRQGRAHPKVRFAF